jgi:hypothetical protein
VDSWGTETETELISDASEEEITTSDFPAIEESKREFEETSRESKESN